jgi:RNA polymerase sigma factor (sigma-70 family)
MPSTIWTLIGKARAGDRAELNLLLRKYRPALLASIRRTIRDPEEAEDIVQQVLVTLIEDDILSKADRSKGRFRCLLWAVTRHVISERRRSEAALKRGGGQKPTSLSSAKGDSATLLIESLIEAPSVDETFDTLWVDNLVRLGMSRLREDCRKNQTPYFDALFAYVNDGLDYAEIARKFSVTATDVKNYLHQARASLRRFVLEEIQAYSSSRTEYDAEVAYMMKYLE